MSAEKIAPGKYVALTYTMFDDQGAVVEDCELPVGFVYGHGNELIGEIDAAILGASEGDVCEVEVPPEKGFGHRNVNLVIREPIDSVPENYRRVGAEVTMSNDQGDTRNFYVTAVDDEAITLDGNHPLAGKHLRVRVKVNQVREAGPDDLRATETTPGAAPGSDSVH
jgi:FKBP-type peptidyl-prolyl cis-trans isomerase SlyD